MDYYSYTNIGCRGVNEDFLGISTHEDAICFAVADGLGGHGGGDVASKCAISEVTRVFMTQGFSEHFFEEAFYSAQNMILKEQADSAAWDRMKTTLVILVISNGYVYYAHIGDSRAYHFKKNKYVLHSEDHSVPQLLVLSGEIKEEEIRFHPDRNRLMRVLGEKDAKPDFSVGKKIKLSGKQAFLLCTDGFWELIDEKEMSETLEKSSTAEEWVTRMIERIQKHGKDTNMDNYTCIAILNEKKGFLGGLI